MKFLRFRSQGRDELGVVHGDGVVPVARLGDNLPANMKHLIQDHEALTLISDALEGYDGKIIEMSAIEWALPISNPDKILCLGLNYVDHAKEGNNVIPDHPTIFLRTIESLAVISQ